MSGLLVRVASLLNRLDAWMAYGECAICGHRHDPREHYPLHDDR